MLKIGDYNTLKVVRAVDFGIYLDGGNGVEILLPAKFVSGSPQPGDEIEVFVYTDSEDRLISTTTHPKARVGEFAFLTVKDTNRFGAFLDWGIMAKDLLVPFREQRARMKTGGTYPVYVYLDDTTKRVVASAKIEKFLGNLIPEYKAGQEVSALVLERTPIGFRVIVDNLFLGMIYDNEIYGEIEIGTTVRARVKHVRPDGKIDLLMKDPARERTEALASALIDYISSRGGVSEITDSSSPELIKNTFGCSKKDFKKAVGSLYREHRVKLSPGKIELTGD